MSGSESRDKDSVTEVAEESFVRSRPPEIERGSVLAGRYQVEDIIGKGGSGIVLRVFDRTAQNVVALKVLKSELALDAKWDKRFSRELRLGRPIQHPNVCRIFDIGEADGHRFLTMELARGGSLRDELKRTRAVDRPIEDKLADARAAIAGLAALHGAGVVHRDFKPDNLLRMEDGRLVLADFGLATDAANAPGATVLIGTPHYMAPEVLNGDPATARSDVWALGVVLHEIFFGQRPERRSVSFDGSSRGPLRPQSPVERKMLGLCDACLAESPLDRPADARVVAQMFESARPIPRLGWRTRTAKIATGVCLSLVLVGVGWKLNQRPGRRNSESAVPVKVPAARKTQVSGQPVDWSRTFKNIADFPGRVHCLSMLDASTARVVWGTPRRAEDVDLSSGRRRASKIQPETYRIGCPEMSPSTGALLFTAESSSGAAEIRLSRAGDGRGAVVITAGSDPVWLGGEDEFVYSIDESHAAAFSLPTMKFAIISSSVLGDHRAVADKAASEDGTAIGLVLYNDRAEFVAAVVDAKTLGHASVVSVPPETRIQFGSNGHRVILTGRFEGGAVTAVEFDWSADALTRLGGSSGYDVKWVRQRGPRELALLRRVSADAWLQDGAERSRLTFDGRNYAASVSPLGDLLLTKLDVGGNYRVWFSGRDGKVLRLTDGSRDLWPTFGADGQSWAYVDYADQRLMLCRGMSGATCRLLRKDELLPVSPTVSPDGEALAYLTELNTPRLTVISTRDGHEISGWGAHWSCPPIWSSPTTLWTVETESGRYLWRQREIANGAKTGKQVELERAHVAPDEGNCWRTTGAVDSSFNRHVTVELQEEGRLIETVGSSSFSHDEAGETRKR